MARLVASSVEGARLGFGPWMSVGVSLVTIWVSWSSGKDCAWSLHRLRQEDRNAEALFTTLNSQADRVAIHVVRRELLHAQSASLRLPLHCIDLPWPCSDEDYQRIMAGFLNNARLSGVTEMAFGDLFLEDIRNYREKNLAGTGIAPVFPLWGSDTKLLAREMLAAGMRARLATVDLARLDVSFAGQPYDEDLLHDLPASVDVCGENGEFHTFVTDGPMFSSPINVETGSILQRDGFAYADLLQIGAPG